MGGGAAYRSFGIPGASGAGIEFFHDRGVAGDGAPAEIAGAQAAEKDAAPGHG